MSFQLNEIVICRGIIFFKQLKTDALVCGREDGDKAT